MLGPYPRAFFEGCGIRKWGLAGRTRSLGVDLLTSANKSRVQHLPHAPAATEGAFLTTVLPRHNGLKLFCEHEPK